MKNKFSIIVKEVSFTQFIFHSIFELFLDENRISIFGNNNFPVMKSELFYEIDSEHGINCMECTYNNIDKITDLHTKFTNEYWAFDKMVGKTPEQWQYIIYPQTVDKKDIKCIAEAYFGMGKYFHVDNHIEDVFMFLPTFQSYSDLKNFIVNSIGGKIEEVAIYQYAEDGKRKYKLVEEN